MRICIVGAGAIGCWIAAQLSLAGEAVTLVARGGQRDIIEREGLVLDTPRFGARSARVARVVGHVADASDCDTVLLTVKAHQLGSVLPDLSGHIARGACLVTLQNGVPWWYLMGSGKGSASDEVMRSVDPDGALEAAAQARSLVGGVLYVAAEVPRPGHVHLAGKGRIVVGEVARGAPGGDDAPSPRTAELAALFKRCDIASEAVVDIRAALWQKLWRNAPFNPISVLTGATMGDIMSDPALERLVLDIMGEAKQVAAAMGVVIAEAAEESLKVAAKIGSHKTSMLQDYERGRRLELGAIAGALIELADRAGVPVPHLRTVLACTAALERLRPASLS